MLTNIVATIFLRSKMLFSVVDLHQSNIVSKQIRVLKNNALQRTE